MDEGRQHDTAHKALVEQVARCRMLLEAAFEGVLISQDGVVTEVSQPLLATSGYTLDEMIGRPIIDFVAEEFRDEVRRRHAADVDGRFDAIAVCKDGRRLHVEVVTKSDVIGGRPARISWLRDVTERKRAHDALKDTDRRLRAVGRLARVGYWEDDVGRNRLTWSQETCDGTETVLVVEDQAGVLGVVEKTLHRFGYTVIATATGSEAVAAARAQAGPIHLMLTDVVLPGGSGREVARQVVAARPAIRVLYMSGYTEDAIVQHGVLEPGLAFIQKPFTGDDLVRRIREVLTAEPPPLF